MQQLNAADSLFLSLEQPECPMNMGLLVMLEGPEQPASVDRLFAALTAGARKIERHHDRLLPAPLGLDHPYWIRNYRLKSAEHFHHHRLPQPGSEEQLQAVIEEILMAPLNRALPLMELHLISGLASRKQAVIFKLHHACADGISALRMFADTVSGATAENAKTDGQFHEQVAPRKLQWLTLWRFLKNPLRPVSLLVLGPVLKLFLHGQASRYNDKQVARTSRFCGPVGYRRSYATVSFPLTAVRRINRRYGSSENELLLTLYSGALRNYLLEKGELPEHSLYGGMPYSMLHSDLRKGAANQVGFARVTLGTRIKDPLQRLLTMKARCARTLNNGPTRMMRRLQFFMRFAAPALVAQAARLYIRLLRHKRIHPTFSAITTYMPGPVRHVQVEEYEITGIYPLGVLYHGCGLSLSAMRYGQNIHCGIVADRDMLPDPENFSAYLRREFDNLCQQADLTGDE